MLVGFRTFQNLPWSHAFIFSKRSLPIKKNLKKYKFWIDSIVFLPKMQIKYNNRTKSKIFNFWTRCMCLENCYCPFQNFSTLLRKEKKSWEGRKATPLNKIFINSDPDIEIFFLLTIKHSYFAWLAELEAKKIQHGGQLFLQYIEESYISAWQQKFSMQNVG